MSASHITRILVCSTGGCYVHLNTKIHTTLSSWYICTLSLRFAPSVCVWADWDSGGSGVGHSPLQWRADPRSGSARWTGLWKGGTFTHALSHSVLPRLQSLFKDPVQKNNHSQRCLLFYCSIVKIFPKLNLTQAEHLFRTDCCAYSVPVRKVKESLAASFLTFAAMSWLCRCGA